jgi:hypothetical protein
MKQEDLTLTLSHSRNSKELVTLKALRSSTGTMARRSFTSPQPSSGSDTSAREMILRQVLIEILLDFPPPSPSSLSEWSEERFVRSFQEIIQKYFIGQMKGPFNEAAREKAGMGREWYLSLSSEVEKLK